MQTRFIISFLSKTDGQRVIVTSLTLYISLILVIKSRKGLRSLHV